MTGKTTLYNEVSRQYALCNVYSIVVNLQKILYRGSMQMLCLQYELLNVIANEMIGKRTLYIGGGGSYGVSLRCELLNVLAGYVNVRKTFHIESN